jgi:hypothetical protein
VSTRQESAQSQVISCVLRERAQWGSAVSADRGEHAALCGNADAGLRIMKPAQQGTHALVGFATLDCERTLAGGGQRRVRLEDLRCAILEPQAQKPGAGQDNCVALSRVHLAKARVDVASKGFDDKIRSVLREGNGAAQARRADAGTARESIECPVSWRHENIAWIFAFWNTSDDEARGDLSGHILHRVNGEVSAFFKEGLLDLLDEQALAADIGERPILNAVPGRDDQEFACFERRLRGAKVDHEGAALCQRQRGSARCIGEERHARGA